MTKLYAGVDPGMSGAIAIIDEDGNYVNHLHMPTVKINTANEVNVPAVADFLSGYHISHCFLEKVQGMNKEGQRQSASTAFKFGDSYGCVKGVICGQMIPLTYMTPQQWKKHAKLIGKDKDASRGRCVQLYPHIKDLALKQKGQALGDALLIARAGLGLA